MSRPTLELADIFRVHGPWWRRANKGHVSLTQLKVMSAIEACRTEALGGHVAACSKCGHQHATIFEMNVESFRRRSALEAKRKRDGQQHTRQSKTHR